MPDKQLSARLRKDVAATSRNKATQANIDKRVAVKSDKPEMKIVDVPGNYLQAGLKRMQTESAGIKTKEHRGKSDKIKGIVASRKQIAAPGKSTSTKGPSKASLEKAISLKR